MSNEICVHKHIGHDDEAYAYCMDCGKNAIDFTARPDEGDKYEKALTIINALRNDIIGRQTVNWSAHIYPLVAALNEAGFEGEPYEIAKEKAIKITDVYNECVELKAQLAASDLAIAEAYRCGQESGKSEVEVELAAERTRREAAEAILNQCDNDALYTCVSCCVTMSRIKFYRETYPEEKK